MPRYQITVYDEGRGEQGEHLRDVEAENADAALASVGYEEILPGVHRDTRCWPVRDGCKGDRRYTILADLIEEEKDMSTKVPTEAEALRAVCVLIDWMMDDWQREGRRPRGDLLDALRAIESMIEDEDSSQLTQ